MLGGPWPGGGTGGCCARCQHQPGWAGVRSAEERPSEGPLKGRGPSAGPKGWGGSRWRDMPRRQCGMKWAGSGVFGGLGGPLVGVQRGLSTRDGGR